MHVYIYMHLQEWNWVFHKYQEKYESDFSNIFRIMFIQIDLQNIKYWLALH